MLVKNIFSLSRKLNISYLCFAIACAFILSSAFLIRTPHEELLNQQRLLSIRSIGDQLLRAHGDLTTPLPPVEKKSPETYILRFDTPISVDPDSLASLALHHLDADIAQKSIVNVIASSSGAMVYGFEINPADQQDIPCLGRKLPIAEYTVEISLYDHPQVKLIQANIPAVSTIGASLIFALIGILLLRRSDVKSTPTSELHWQGISLDTAMHRIKTPNDQVQLTKKESQILALLLERPGEIVTRDVFMTRVWFSEGVVTERSLDMYISRLRKKLKAITEIQIANLHGQGYYLKSADSQ